MINKFTQNECLRLQNLCETVKQKVYFKSSCFEAILKIFVHGIGKTPNKEILQFQIKKKFLIFEKILSIKKFRIFFKQNIVN